MSRYRSVLLLALMTVVSGWAGCTSEPDGDQASEPWLDDDAAFSGTCDPARAAGAVTPFERALLDTIATTEGTKGVSQDGYNEYFTGALFSDCTHHPDVKHCSGNLCSDAAGRYQFLFSTWQGLGFSTFYPDNQDRGAMKLVRDKRHAVVPTDRALTHDEFVQVMGTCNTKTGAGLALEWASLPPGCYGQPSRTMAQAWAIYQGFAGHATSQPGPVDFYVLVGDWNGDGVKTPGFFNTHTFHWQLGNFNQASGVAYDFGWGGPGWLPVVGDWDGNGTDTPGLYNPTTHEWRLSNHNSAGGVDISFGWGGDGWIPVVGDWNGDGKTTPGLYNPTTHEWHLSNHNSSGGVDASFGWGGDGWIPVAGDWDGNHTDTPGLYNPTTHDWHLSNHNSAGGVDASFGWGGNGTLPVVGDWNKDGKTTPGLFEPASRQWSLSNVNASGGVAARFGWGGAGTYTTVGGPTYTAR